MIKRKIYSSIFKGSISQLLYLIALCVVLIIALSALGLYITGDSSSYRVVISRFLGMDGILQDKNPLFLFTIDFLGVVLFSSVFVSLLVGIINSISDNYRNGDIKYHVKNQYLILGGGNHLSSIIRALDKNGVKDNIIVVTDQDVATLRERVKSDVNNDNLSDRLIYYRGDYSSVHDLKTAHPEWARAIYIIGDQDSTDHDSSCLKCLSIVKSMTANSDHDIYCYLVLDSSASMDIIRYTTSTQESPRLKTDFVLYNEYQAEQLLVKTDFLPAVRYESEIHSHIFIFGTTELALELGKVASLISHYPNYNSGNNRTIITFVGEQMKEFKDRMIVSYSSLFELSHWSYVCGDTGKTMVHTPSSEIGDYIDVEWEFINASAYSPVVRERIECLSNDDNCALSIISAGGKQDERINNLASLSKIVNCNLAVYLDSDFDLVNLMEETKLFGRIYKFGPATENDDALFENRVRRGQRVNFIYDQAYSSFPSDTPEHAWYMISEAHKQSSIYNANAMPLKLRSYDFADCDRPIIYEGEHRRWMSAVLVLGYSAMNLTASKAARADRSEFKRLKSSFIHPDICPYDELPEEEMEKDKLLVDSMEFIMNG